jgi:hypothetical protein
MPEVGIKIGDIGTLIRITIKDQAGVVINLSNASEKVIKFRSPEQVTYEKTSAFTTDGSDGKIEYELVAGDIIVAGEWRVQCTIALPSLGEWNTDIVTMRVGGVI